MEKHIFLRIAIGYVLTNIFTTGYYADSCPSPPVTYASEGDNVTLCWRLLPVANSSDLTRFTVMALKRPVEAMMEKVASANKDGTFFRVYDKHGGLYENRATAFADLPGGMLFLKLRNYTSRMENIYCILYEMSGPDHVRTCHFGAVLLRDRGLEVPSSDDKTTSTAETTMTTVTDTTVRRQAPTEGGRRVSSSDHKAALIVVSCLLGIVSILAIVGFMLFCNERKGSPLKPKKARLDICKKV